MPGACLADGASMFSQSLSIPLGTDLVQKSRRALDVGEQKRHCAGRQGVDIERWSLSEDRLLHLAQRPARLQPKLVMQDLPGVSIHAESFGLSAGAVERTHHLRSEAFPKRMLGDERLQLRHNFAMSTTAEVGFDAVLERLQTLLLEALGFSP